MAVGAPIVLKPAPATPLTALLLGELLAETDLPAGAWSVLPVPNEVAADLVRDPRLPVVSFTGSVPVGWSIRDSVPRKHVTLELGGNAAVVVGPGPGDDEVAGLRGHADRHVRDVPGGPVLHLGAAGVRPPRRGRDADRAGGRGRRTSWSPATRPTTRPTSAR